jgi:hypothetical protein
MSRQISGYVELDASVTICIYCGLSKDVLDHALPYSRRNSVVAVSRILVPACNECNSLLASAFQETLDERIKEAKWRLQCKYSKIISIPNWTTEELSDLNERLREGVIRSIDLKKLIVYRIAFDYFLWEELGRPESLLP